VGVFEQAFARLLKADKTKPCKIKPILRVVDGHVSMRGLARSCERRLAQIQQEVSRMQPVERLAVVYARYPEEA
jgi:fatty acid-binding protein DegV